MPAVCEICRLPPGKILPAFSTCWHVVSVPAAVPEYGSSLLIRQINANTHQLFAKLFF
jgi:hypothetical protein